MTFIVDKVGNQIRSSIQTRLWVLMVSDPEFSKFLSSDCVTSLWSHVGSLNVFPLGINMHLKLAPSIQGVEVDTQVPADRDPDWS